MRSEVISYLTQKRRNNSNYRVIDIGGANNPWCDEFVDAYVDIWTSPDLTDTKLS
jgi:hypothetical protein